MYRKVFLRSIKYCIVEGRSDVRLRNAGKQSTVLF